VRYGVNGVNGATWDIKSTGEVAMFTLERGQSSDGMGLTLLFSFVV